LLHPSARPSGNSAGILKALIERTGIDPARVDDVVFSQGYGNGEAPAIGHWSWLAAGYAARSARLPA
jgi:acetyl-CoA C-acetyltransferase